MTSDDMTFDEWIVHVFGHPVTEPAWYWDPDASFWEGPPATVVAYLTRLFLDVNAVLAPYSDAQAAQGLWAVISNGPTDYPFTLLDTSVPLAARLGCVEAMWPLFRDYFARWCTPHLSHLDREVTPPHVSPLNAVCYMWWDILPLHGLAEHRPDHPDGPALDRAILSVIRRCLDLDSPACQESAAHGLFEWEPYFDPGAVAADFLARRPDLTPELRTFVETYLIGRT